MPYAPYDFLLGFVPYHSLVLQPPAVKFLFSVLAVFVEHLMIIKQLVRFEVRAVGVGGVSRGKKNPTRFRLLVSERGLMGEFGVALDLACSQSAKTKNKNFTAGG